METENKRPIGKILFSNGMCVYVILTAISFLLKELLNYAWINYASGVLLVLYMFFSLWSIFSNNSKPLFELDKRQLCLYQIVLPSAATIVAGCLCIGAKQSGQGSFAREVIIWIKVECNQQLLLVIFALMVVVSCFLAFRREQLQKSDNLYRTEIDKIAKQYQENHEKGQAISEGIKDLRLYLENKNMLAYTTTCIPIKYCKEHDTFMFALIKNPSHEECQWMFPGSHVEIYENCLQEPIDLTGVEMIPGKVIEEKVKNEAGLLDLTFIDTNYDVINMERTANGKAQRTYPNTCYPAKTPVFNYLFKVHESAKCYKTRNHRCHYDFTYVGEYNTIDMKEAMYDVIEVEFNRNKKIENMNYSEAISYISAKLADQINRKIKAENGKRVKTSVPATQLFLDSIPEILYNAILFYIDYKKDVIENVQEDAR